MPTLNWIGKDKVINHHHDVQYKILEHKYGFTSENGKKQFIKTNCGNKIINGDNLEALKSLLPEYEGKVDIIYIDPPYNTGKENWVYNDNVNSPKIQNWIGEVVGKEGDDLTRHDKWLCMMYPRLQLLYKLLSKDGVIFISIDDNEYAVLKLICDEIFGSNNCIGPIIQNKMNSKNDTVNVQKNHEYIHIYRKSKTFSPGDKKSSTLINSMLGSKEVYEEDGEFYYKNDYITTRGEGGTLNARQKLGHTVYYNSKTKDIKAVCDYDVELAKTSNDFNLIYTNDKTLINEGYVPIRPPKVRDKLGSWTWSLDKINKQKKDLLVTGTPGSYNLMKRTFVSKGDVFKVNGKFFINILKNENSRSIIDFSTNEGTKILNEIMNKQGVFDNPKNIKMLEYLISLYPKKDALILDSFAGSGSTAHAVLNLNKNKKCNYKFILIEMEEYTEEITSKRIQNVINGYVYTGKTKEIINEYPINIKSLKRADIILEKVEMLKKNTDYSKITLGTKDDKIVIFGEKTVAGKMEGTGGSFDYYEIGLPIFDDNNNLNEKLPLNKIKEYIWFSETRSPFTNPDKEQFFLGIKNETVYYLMYYKEKLTTLDFDTIEIVKTKGELYIIYADNCLLPKEYMTRNNIIFKKIPRDITRF